MMMRISETSEKVSSSSSAAEARATPPRASDGLRDLVGRTALVTGATSGLGLEAATQLAERGAKVIFGIRNPAKAERVVAAVRKRYTRNASSPSLDFVLPPAVPPLDLSDPASVSRFANAMLADTATPLHILINNAGTSMLQGPAVDERGVNRLVQVNYLGAYHLTRLLEAKLIASGCRVVAVTSVTHRSYELPTDPRVFLHSTDRITYAWSKVANVLFAYELQRRLGPLGIQSCAVDPGGVRTAIWDEVPALAQPPAKWVIDMLYAPPEDGAEVLVAAATLPWERDRVPHVLSPAHDLRYYARGAFTSPLVTLVDGAWRDWYHIVKPSLYGISVLIHSLVDYPLRRFSGGRMFNQTMPVRSARQTYDTQLAAALWSYSEQVTGLMAAKHSPRPALAEAAAHVGGGKAAVNGSAVSHQLRTAAAAGYRCVGGLIIRLPPRRSAPEPRTPTQEEVHDTPGGGGGGGGGCGRGDGGGGGDVGSAARRPLVDSSDLKSPPDSDSSHASLNRKRPVLSPPKFSFPAIAAVGNARPESPDIVDAVEALFPAAALSPEEATAARRRVIAARREVELAAGGGGGGGIDGGDGAPMPAVEVPPPPESLQHLAKEHGIVLPGPLSGQAAAAAATAATTAPATTTGVGGGCAASTQPGEYFLGGPDFEGPRTNTPAPPPHKRLQTRAPGEESAPLMYVTSVGAVGGGGGGGADTPTSAIGGTGAAAVKPQVSGFGGGGGPSTPAAAAVERRPGGTDAIAGGTADGGGTDAIAGGTADGGGTDVIASSAADGGAANVSGTDHQSIGSTGSASGSTHGKVLEPAVLSVEEDADAAAAVTPLAVSVAAKKQAGEQGAGGAEKMKAVPSPLGKSKGSGGGAKRTSNGGGGGGGGGADGQGGSQTAKPGAAATAGGRGSDGSTSTTTSPSANASGKAKAKGSKHKNKQRH